MVDLLPFDPGQDSRTDPFEETGNDEIRKQHIVSSNSCYDTRAFLMLFRLKMELLIIFWAWRHPIKEFETNTMHGRTYFA